jgi:hypothetical protein
VNHPIRVRAGSFINDPDYFAKYVALAGAKAAQQNGVVLILLDCDDDCPGVLGPALLAGARRIRGDVPILVGLAHREYETWFLAAARSLRGRFGLADDIEPPPEPERIRAAKEWLGRHMDAPYDPIVHQAALTGVLNLTEACNSRSFERLRNRIAELLDGPGDAQ